MYYTTYMYVLICRLACDLLPLPPTPPPSRPSHPSRINHQIMSDPAQHHPARAHSEGDIPKEDSPTYKEHPLKHVASYTFGSKKFGGRTVKKQWKFAALKTKELPDPWVGLGFDKIKEEVATRHMYNPRNGKWKTDKITVKMQSEVRTRRERESLSIFVHTV